MIEGERRKADKMAPSDPREAALLSWLSTYRGTLIKIARSFASDPVEQAELMQEMAVQLWESIPRFRGDAKPLTWVYRVCLNSAMTWRRAGRAQRLEISLETLPELAGADPSNGNDELVRAMYEAIRGLTAIERSILMPYLDGMSYLEISEITGTTEGSVGVALTRIRKKLASQLEGVRREL